MTSIAYREHLNRSEIRAILRQNRTAGQTNGTASSQPQIFRTYNKPTKELQGLAFEQLRQGIPYHHVAGSLGVTPKIAYIWSLMEKTKQQQNNSINSVLAAPTNTLGKALAPVFKPLNHSEDSTK